MSSLIIKGGNRLSGEITPSGNKNSVLPILCSTLLTNETVVLENVPALTDVTKLVEQLISIGSEIKWDKENSRLEINNSNINKDLFDGDFPIGMRGSLLLFSPLLYRMKSLHLKNEIGGCALGIREIDPHIEALEALGTSIDYGDTIVFKIKERFVGGFLWPDYMSVTATENFINAAVLAKGSSKLVNAASEPHVQDLCNFLNQLGAKIKGIGTSVLEIEGVEELRGGTFRISSDHHEITTMLALGAMTGGEVKVHNAIPEHFPLINRAFNKLGVVIEYEGDTAIVRPNQTLKVESSLTENMLTRIEAAPWPYFPVDLLPLLIALSVKSDGSILFWNKVYEGGFFWIQELMKFGAKVVMADPHRIIVFGGRKLSPAVVNSPNIIRAAICLTMVALSTEGESVVNFADSIKRAHPNFSENLKLLGADIEWRD